MSKKLHELTDEELAQVVGGASHVKDYVLASTVVTGATVAIATADDFARQISGVK